ncbi:MAG: hypothetical protein NTX82_00470 [Candidatus Parcubacteria bacterium]|nr:hypothetical protein [Candidatus Parcubacteria bacterium]
MERIKFIPPKIEKHKLSETQDRLEKLFELKKQYQEQVKALIATGVIELLPETGKYGVYDIKGKECPIPSYDEILKRMESKEKMLTKKKEQGFGKLLLVPIGTPLSFLIDRTSDLIVKKHKEGNLLGTDGKNLELDENQPVYVDDIYKDADIKGDLVYFPQQFDKENHGGVPKAEMKEAWQLLFIEDQPDMPDKGKEINGRKQFDAGQSPEVYLKKIQTDSQYANEQFTTPEAQLIYFMEYLQRNNQVIDDWDGKGKGKRCWNVGAYFKGSDLVPRGYWDRSYGGSYGLFRLYEDISGRSFGVISVRASVKF